MGALVFTPTSVEAGGDAAAIAKYQAALAALRPSAEECRRCQKALGKRELAAGAVRCTDEVECTVRSIFRGSGRSADMRGFRELREYQAARGISSVPVQVKARMVGPVGPSCLDVAEEILRSSRRRPKLMKVGDLARAVVASGRAVGLNGKTPEATVSARIYTAAKDGRVFVKVDRGVVGLIEAAAPSKVAA